MLTDPIADMFVRIKNALMNQEEQVIIPASKLKLAILKVLKERGYIVDFKQEEQDKKKNIRIKIRYDDNKSVISQIRRISKPGLRIYANYKNIPRPLQGLGLVVLSTPQGVMSGQEAKKKKLGGEVICEVY